MNRVESGGVQRYARDFLNIAAIWFLIAFASGAQAWTSLDTPDSEFHASMAIYGSEVTDRAATPVYYWTRLGYIAPAHALTSLFGPIAGLEILRLVLLLIMVVAIYATLKSFTNRLNTALLTLMISANTVILGYLGNPYPSAVIMAAIFVIIALVVTGDSWWRDFAVGAIAAWLIMTNPYGAIVAGVVFVSLVVALPASRNKWKLLLRRIALGATGFVLIFAALWLLGREMFPTLDWLSTYTYWNSALRQSDYIFDRNRWTWDPSLLVIAVALVISWIGYAQFRKSIQVRFAFAMSTAVPVFALLYWQFFPSNYLEIPHYQAILWPTALMAIGLVAATKLPQVSATWPKVFIGAASVIIVIVAGYSTIAFETWQSRVIALLAVAAFFIGRRDWSIVLLGIMITFSLSQLLQNSRDNFGVSSEYLYSNAFRSNEVGSMMTSAVQAQDFVLSQTKPGDRTLTWVDANWSEGEQSLLPLAAFQLWGANELGKGPEVTADMLKRLQEGKPLSIALYGKSKESILKFWNSIPKTNSPTAPTCIEIPWTNPELATVCVTRLNWA